MPTFQMLPLLPLCAHARLLLRLLENFQQSVELNGPLLSLQMAAQGRICNARPVLAP